MAELLRFLRTHKLAWILPIIVFLAVLLLIAGRIARTPENPFVYDTR
jgi:hypothetical protein